MARREIGPVRPLRTLGLALGDRDAHKAASATRVLSGNGTAISLIEVGGPSVTTPLSLATITSSHFKAQSSETLNPQSMINLIATISFRSPDDSTNSRRRFSSVASSVCGRDGHLSGCERCLRPGSCRLIILFAAAHFRKTFSVVKRRLAVVTLNFENSHFLYSSISAATNS